MDRKDRIAVIIPAYKPDFFIQVMECLSSQTCKDFTIYIGDDNSPADFHGMIAPYCSQLDIRYRKFEENLGGKDLVGHWERCIRMSDEKWILLFSDDDLMPSDAIERCYRAIEQYPDREFFRFKLDVVDADGNCTQKAADWSSEFMSSAEYLCEYMNMKRNSAVCEHFFSRDIFEAYGMVHFPMAWCADIALWSTYAEKNGLVNLDGAAFKWRNVEGVNISSSSVHNDRKISALIMFVDFLNGRYPYLRHNRNFARALYTYCKVIFLYSIKGDYTFTDLLNLCSAVCKMSPTTALQLFFRLIHIF